MVKTCDIHQTRRGRLRIRPFSFFLADTHTLSHTHTTYLLIFTPTVWFLCRAPSPSCPHRHARAVSSPFPLCRVLRATFSSRQTPAPAHSRRRHMHTRTAAYAPARALLQRGKLLSDTPRLGGGDGGARGVRRGWETVVSSPFSDMKP